MSAGRQLLLPHCDLKIIVCHGSPSRVSQRVLQVLWLNPQVLPLVLLSLSLGFVVYKVTADHAGLTSRLCPKGFRCAWSHLIPFYRLRN